MLRDGEIIGVELCGSISHRCCTTIRYSARLEFSHEGQDWVLVWLEDYEIPDVVNRCESFFDAAAVALGELLSGGGSVPPVTVSATCRDGGQVVAVTPVELTVPACSVPPPP